jgi:predicted amidohydrolase
MNAFPAELTIKDLAEYGRNQHRGNVVGIQPYMVAGDYRSGETLEAKLRGYLLVAHAQGWLGGKSIVVFPEYIGTWLVAAGEAAELYEAQDLASAMRTLIRKNPIPFLLNLVAARGKDRVADALFRMKAVQMAESYQALFSALAMEFGVTVVAGSIVLPSARVERGKLRTSAGPLHNSSVVFRPDGSPYDQIVHKWYPIARERPFIAGAPGSDLPVFETAAGLLGVLICADSWYPEPYLKLAEKGCQILVVPNNLVPMGVWRELWRGYDPGPAPEDVGLDDVAHLSEGEAWLKYALAGRIATSGASHGIHVFFRGQMWDLGSDGHTILVQGDQTINARDVVGAAVVNLWL